MHISLKMREEINKTTNTLHFTFPYKPKTNAVESWFSQFKHYLKLDSLFLSYNSLKNHINKVISSIPKKHYLAYMKINKYINTHQKLLVQEKHSKPIKNSLFI